MENLAKTLLQLGDYALGGGGVPLVPGPFYGLPPIQSPVPGPAAGGGLSQDRRVSDATRRAARLLWSQRTFLLLICGEICEAITTFLRIKYIVQRKVFPQGGWIPIP